MSLDINQKESSGGLKLLIHVIAKLEISPLTGTKLKSGCKLRSYEHLKNECGRHLPYP
jgi:hypothetical protein